MDNAEGGVSAILCLPGIRESACMHRYNDSTCSIRQCVESLHVDNGDNRDSRISRGTNGLTTIVGFD